MLSSVLRLKIKQMVSVNYYTCIDFIVVPTDLILDNTTELLVTQINFSLDDVTGILVVHVIFSHMSKLLLNL